MPVLQACKDCPLLLLKKKEDSRLKKQRDRESELLGQLHALPLASTLPPMGADLIDRLATAVMAYPSHIYRAITKRAERYDAAWGFRGESEIAAFLDFQCLRCRRSLRTFIPAKRMRLPAWLEYNNRHGVKP